MTKILWQSNAPWTTSGYGQQSALTVPRLATLGHDIAFSCFFGLEGSALDWRAPEPFNSIHKCYPTDRTRFGMELLPDYADHHAGGRHKCLVMTLMDVWVMVPAIDQLKDMEFVCWTPVDHDPVPPMVLDFLRGVDARVISMSQFGHDRLEKEGFEPMYAPHGIDTSIFKPDPDARARGRERRAIPDDAFVVGMVAANMGIPSRKAFPAAFEAFAAFRASHPDAMLYLHTDTGGHYNGVNLPALAGAVGIPHEVMRATPFQDMQIGMPQQDVAEVYNVCDVLLMPSMGEGFGIPSLEAQSCGVPVITTDWTAMPEMVGGGWIVNGDRFWDASQRSFFKLAAQSEILAALNSAWEHRADQELKAAARTFALGYDIDKVFEECWRPIMEKITTPREVPPLRLAA